MIRLEVYHVLQVHLRQGGKAAFCNRIFLEMLPGLSDGSLCAIIELGGWPDHQPSATKVCFGLRHPPFCLQGFSPTKSAPFNGRLFINIRRNPLLGLKGHSLLPSSGAPCLYCSAEIQHIHRLILSADHFRGARLVCCIASLSNLVYGCLS